MPEEANNRWHYTSKRSKLFTLSKSCGISKRPQNFSYFWQTSIYSFAESTRCSWPTSHNNCRSFSYCREATESISCSSVLVCSWQRPSCTENFLKSFPKWSTLVTQVGHLYTLCKNRTKSGQLTRAILETDSSGQHFVRLHRARGRRPSKCS